MPQNIVDAVLTAEAETAARAAITTIRENLPFLVSLNPAQRTNLLKAGNVYLPFVNIALDTITEFPQVVSPLFDKEGFLKDKELLDKLTALGTLIASLNEAVDDTLMALRSDLFVAALDLYGSVQQNKDKLPGLDTRCAQMQEFFKKGKSKPSPAGQ